MVVWSNSDTHSEEDGDVRPDLSRGHGLPVLDLRRLHAPLRPYLRRTAMGWEDILGLVVTVGLLWYLLSAMLKAEKV
jgi:K+-transporting ATPase KdpF subunit